MILAYLWASLQLVEQSQFYMVETCFLKTCFELAQSRTELEQEKQNQQNPNITKPTCLIEGSTA